MYVYIHMYVYLYMHIFDVSIPKIQPQGFKKNVVSLHAKTFCFSPLFPDSQGENAHAGLLTGIVDGLNFTIKEEAAKDPPFWELLFQRGDPRTHRRTMATFLQRGKWM